MKQYRILKHPAGTIEAVKQGWSWPALFFTFIWAFVKRMWMLGGAVLALAFLVSIVLESIADPATVDGLSNVIGIVVSIVFGLRGNIWRENNLLSRGFEHVDTVLASNPEGAIAVYLKGGAPEEQPGQGPGNEPPPAV